ncbi:MAG: hypothetical protein C6I01_00435 [Epsilonproteobacteria bacterium]|jgi:TRAP transporter TAXI family solute receptor|nr:hypothetical protein [Campylobacterota bacterium]NPA89319.1 TAXI family TRAP transporter solute-binding subunit [Campylobacterota bacterium]
MKKISRLFLPLLLLITGVWGRYLTIGTGPINGLYYPTATAICNFINRKGEGIKCTSSSSIGSTYNLYYLQQNLYDVVIAQADATAIAWRGEGVFKGHPFKKLRVLIALYPEYFTILTKKGSGISRFSDLVNHKVGMGDPRSGTEITFRNILKYSNLPQSKFKIRVFSVGEMPSKLERGVIDAFFFVVGHPNYTIKEAVYLLGNRVKFVPLSNQLIAKLTNSPYYYTRGEIDGALYGLKGKTPTISTKALLLTTSDMPEEEAYRLTKLLISNFEEFRLLAPALRRMKKEDLVKGFDPNWLHPGARRALKEAGLIK